MMIVVSSSGSVLSGMHQLLLFSFEAPSHTTPSTSVGTPERGTYSRSCAFRPRPYGGPRSDLPADGRLHPLAAVGRPAVSTFLFLRPQRSRAALPYASRSRAATLPSLRSGQARTAQGEPKC